MEQAFKDMFKKLFHVLVIYIQLASSVIYALRKAEISAKFKIVSCFISETFFKCIITS